MGPDPSTAILLTPAGGAAIAVVRLAGPSVGEFLRRHFDKAFAPGRCVHGTLTDGVRVLDDPVVVISPDGHVADVNLHGGPWVVRSVLELARREGFDVIDRHGMSLPEAAVDAETVIGREVEQYLPLATTEVAVRTLLAQPAAWAALNSADAPRMLVDRSLYWLLRPPRVAIIGIPNVGKSTLANRLFGAERVITADVPGTTRDWVGEIANVDGLAVMLVDTPGARATDDLIEREAIDRSRDEVAQADLIVLLVDQSQLPEAQKEQQALMRQYPFNSQRVLYVVNKADLPKRWGVFVDVQWPRTVAITGEGVAQVREAIKRRFLGPDPFAIDRPRWWTPRQRALLEQSIAARSASDR